jgi:hypothetical protein
MLDIAIFGFFGIHFPCHAVTNDIINNMHFNFDNVSFFYNKVDVLHVDLSLYL